MPLSESWLTLNASRKNRISLGPGLETEGVYVLPVAQVSVHLHILCREVDGMAAEKEIVDRRDGKSITHEYARVNDQS